MGGGSSSPVDDDDDDLIPSAVGGNAPFTLPPLKPNCHNCAIEWSSWTVV